MEQNEPTELPAKNWNKYFISSLRSKKYRSMIYHIIGIGVGMKDKDLQKAGIVLMDAIETAAKQAEQLTKES